MVARLVPPESPTAKILGGVAVGIAGVVVVAYAVNHFRKGGSVSGLVNKIKSQKGAITQAANLLPMNEAQKAKLNAAINAAANSKDLQERFASIGFAVEPATPEALGQRTRLETVKWAKAIKDAGMEPE